MSVLGLRGDKQDDPDLYPVRLPSSPNDFIKIEGMRPRRAGNLCALESIPADSISSPTASNVSSDLPRMQINQLDDIKVQKRPITALTFSRANSRASTDSIEAVDLDVAYRPPVERLPKPGEYQ